jgi:hypothetical protein
LIKRWIESRDSASFLLVIDKKEKYRLFFESKSTLIGETLKISRPRVVSISFSTIAKSMSDFSC